MIPATCLARRSRFSRSEPVTPDATFVTDLLAKERVKISRFSENSRRDTIRRAIFRDVEFWFGPDAVSYVGAPINGSAWLEDPRTGGGVYRGGSFAAGAVQMRVYERNGFDPLAAAHLTSLPAPATLTPLVGAGALLYHRLLPVAARRTSANRDRILTAIARS